ncbi:MAG: hypothetical protein MZW92_15205 [Comamonadaceae bacterium]|nr:hypothetical protein [Comamonadaceae bacterium]
MAAADGQGAQSSTPKAELPAGAQSDGHRWRIAWAGKGELVMVGGGEVGQVLKKAVGVFC